MDKFIWHAGSLNVRMTNDVLFKHLLQRSDAVLQEMICSLLHMERYQIKSTIVTNPILQGQAIDDQTVILDVNVLMNDASRIDFEMQVIDYKDWIERSIIYTARNFDDLKIGNKTYLNTKPSVHFGFLSFSPFNDHQKFYSLNKIMDVEDHHLYTDKFVVGYVDITRIDLATDIDRKYNVDKWARFFSAKTWEDIKMLAARYPIIEEAATHLAKISEDEYIRLQMQAREDQLIRQRELVDMVDEAESRANEAEFRANEAESNNIIRIIKKLRKNKSSEQIADELEESDNISGISEIVGLIREASPDLDMDENELAQAVLEKLNNKSQR